MKTNNNRNEFILIYIVVFVTFLMSKGLSLLPAFSIDDYGMVQQDRSALASLWQGRFTEELIVFFVTNLGLNLPPLAWPVVFMLFGFASWAITLGVLYVANNRGAAIGLAAAGSIMASHPYFTEYFTFRAALLTQVTSFAMIAFIFYIYGKLQSLSEYKKFLGRFCIVIFMVLSAGATQTAFIVLGFFIVGGLVVRIADKNTGYRLIKGRQLYDLLVLYLISLTLYVFIYLLIKAVVDGPLDPRSGFIKFDDIGNRLKLIILLSSKLLLEAEPFLSFGVKAYTFGILLLLLFILGFNQPRTAFLILITGGLFYCGSIFFVSVSGVWWPVPRAVYGIGFALGILLLLVLIYIPQNLARLFPALVFIAALGMTFHSNSVLYDQIRLNRWDEWVATSIAHDLLKLNASTESKVVIVGPHWAHPLGLKTLDGDVNASALNVPWAVNYLFMEVTGRRWNVEIARKHQICDGVPAWPSNESIKQADSKFYVCMGSQN